MELDAPVEPTIGPYEVYEDEWFNFKAAFEAFITVRDDAESAKLQTFSKHLQALENALPIDPKYRNAKLGELAPIKVVNVVLTAGAFRVNGDGTFAVDEAKIAGAVTALTREIMTLQAEGSYEKAKTLIEKLGVVRPAGAEGPRPAHVGAGRYRAQVHVGGNPAALKSRSQVAMRGCGRLPHPSG